MKFIKTCKLIAVNFSMLVAKSRQIFSEEGITMSLSSLKLKRILEKRLDHPQYRTSYNREKDSFRIEWKETNQGMTVKLSTVIAKYNERGEAAIDELVEHISEALKIMNEQHDLLGKEKKIFPVIRATSFPTETKAGEQLVTTDHT